MNDKVTYENLENLSNETEKDKSKLQATPRVRRSAELENADEANTKILNGKDKNNIYARGFYDKNVNGYIFQFTDKASDFVETKINFKLMMLVNPDGARKQGKYDLHLGIGDKNYNAGKVNITYTKNAIKVEAMQGYLMQSIKAELEETHALYMRRKNMKQYNIFNE
ncbi:TPA: hypothetical protein PIY08_002647 [Staphylococcus aureus]|nr:hypothetical protein [Staphylococcus aureus]HDH4207203.1 hypothetical protein [Staphylococcus aureus]HDH4244578.1 hypothetical protein [Staphylococcus aureus]HDH4317923.1 hypothetical protein [Staphylococcus aureus]HDH4323214.1 hypothetical protein [Staphylococcus aureus]